jgi:hypothetical protein
MITPNKLLAIPIASKIVIPDSNYNIYYKK